MISIVDEGFVISTQRLESNNEDNASNIEIELILVFSLSYYNLHIRVSEPIIV